MTDGEIVRMYKGAANKGAQIQILADLNQTSRLKIIEILLRKGVEVRIHFSERGKKKIEETDREYDARLIKRMDDLELKIFKLESEYREIAAIVKTIKR